MLLSAGKGFRLKLSLFVSHIEYNSINCMKWVVYQPVHCEKCVLKIWDFIGSLYSYKLTEYKNIWATQPTYRVRGVGGLPQTSKIERFTTIVSQSSPSLNIFGGPDYASARIQYTYRNILTK